MDDRAALLVACAAVLAGAWWWMRRAQAGTFELVEDSPLSAAANTAADLVETVRAAAWTPPAAAAPYLNTIAAAEARHGLPRNLLARLLWQESRYRPDIINGAVRSPAGALGIAQFMPATARDLGVDPLDPAAAIEAAARYLAGLYRRFGNWREALAAYNWGQGNVARQGIAAAPAETRGYFTSILSDLGLT